jgi:hypothetical protein
VKELAQAKGVDLPFIFQNDANHDQSPLRTYPAENLAKLKAASLKYDPKQVFQTLQGDGFLLPKLEPCGGICHLDFYIYTNLLAKIESLTCNNITLTSE